MAVIAVCSFLQGMKKGAVGWKGKRGASTVTILKAFGIAMAAVVIVMLIQYVRDVKDNTFLEKNYVARDLAMLLTTAYASPGELTYCYYKVGDFSGKFDYGIGNSEVKVGNVVIFNGDSEVVVADHGLSLIESPTRYPYVDDKKQPVNTLLIKGEEAEKLAVLVIKKNSGGVSIAAKMKGEDALPCKP